MKEGTMSVLLTEESPVLEAVPGTEWALSVLRFVERINKFSCRIKHIRKEVKLY